MILMIFKKPKILYSYNISQCFIYFIKQVQASPPFHPVPPKNNNNPTAINKNNYWL